MSHAEAATSPGFVLDLEPFDACPHSEWKRRWDRLRGHNSYSLTWSALLLHPREYEHKAKDFVRFMSAVYAHDGYHGPVLLTAVVSGGGAHPAVAEGTRRGVRKTGFNWPRKQRFA